MRVVIGFKMGGSANHFFSALSDLYHFYGLYSTRKYVEQFSNGISIISIYLKNVPDDLKSPPIENSIHQVRQLSSPSPSSYSLTHYALLPLSDH